MLPSYCKYTQDFKDKVPGGNNPTDKHIVYAERDMKVRLPFHCETKDDTTVSLPQSVLQRPDTAQGTCAKIYVEANYDLYQNKGSVTAGQSFSWRRGALLASGRSIRTLLILWFKKRVAGSRCALSDK